MLHLNSEIGPADSNCSFRISVMIYLIMILIQFVDHKSISWSHKLQIFTNFYKLVFQNMIEIQNMIDNICLFVYSWMSEVEQWKKKICKLYLCCYLLKLKIIIFRKQFYFLKGCSCYLNRCATSPTYILYQLNEKK